MATAGTTTVVPGATPDAGVINSPDGSTTFSGIEQITVTGLAGGANTLAMQGTNGHDTMALQHLGGPTACGSTIGRWSRSPTIPPST